MQNLKYYTLSPLLFFQRHTWLLLISLENKLGIVKVVYLTWEKIEFIFLEEKVMQNTTSIDDLCTMTGIESCMILLVTLLICCPSC